jgi:uncharacterized protein
MQERVAPALRSPLRALSGAMLLALLGMAFGGLFMTGAASAADTAPGGGTPAFPALTGRVVDLAGLVSPASRETLTRELAAHESATGQQVVVVTLPSLGGRAIEEYGYQLGRHWGIGRADHDDGVLLLVAAAERQIRIEVGYGLEGTLTDAASWDIIQSQMVPWFRKGDYDAGIRAGTRAILAVLTGDAVSAAQAEPADAQRRDLPGALIFWIFTIFILANAFGGGRRRRLARAGLPGIVLGGPRGMPGSFGGGGFGGGGFGGRGGGFGGGGASGGW